MASLSFACNDPLTAEQFTVQRSQGGYYDAGGWSDQYTTLNYYGVIRPLAPKEVDMEMEADRVHGTIEIRCELPLYVTRVAPEIGGPATSDIVIWHNQNYRVVSAAPYDGFWAAVAVRMEGA